MTESLLMDVSSGARSASAGFTLIELVVIMVLLAILAVSALPKLTVATGMRDVAWHDELLSSARMARMVATSHRRVVCLSVSSASVSLLVAVQSPATACANALVGPDGASTFAKASGTSGSTTLSQGGSSYSGYLYFQPDGRVTTDLAGTTTGQWTITVSGADNISIDGNTGYAR